MFPRSPALFLPAETVANSSGRLTPRIINSVCNEVCRWAQVKGKKPRTRPATPWAGTSWTRPAISPPFNASFGHKNAAYSLQYARITDDELQEVVDEV